MEWNVVVERGEHEYDCSRNRYDTPSPDEAKSQPSL